MHKGESRITYWISALLSMVERFFSNRVSIFTKKNTLLFLKLDSIGDYILVRNFIQSIKESDKYKDYEITVCGTSCGKIWQNTMTQNMSQSLYGLIIIEC